jgi:uncharacterized protein YnzC (UPF0291/DUF896 family)
MQSDRLFELSKTKKKRILTDAEYEEREKLIKQLEHFIKNNCRNAIEEETIRKRFVDGLSWEKVADEVMDLTSDAPRKRTKRALLRH